MEFTATPQRSDMRERSVRVEGVDAPLRTVQLSGERAVATITSQGTGSLTYNGLAVTRAAGDALCRPGGTFIYFRDLDDGRFWSIGRQPTWVESDSYSFDADEKFVRIERTDGSLHATMTATLAADDVEVRRVTLVNRGDQTRTIEATSYLEWVLQDAGADAVHPAFSKLFVETQYHAEHRLISARRRRREPAQSVLAGGHWIGLLNGRLLQREIQSESNRRRFLGRGCDASKPVALREAGPMLGEFGPVLDPIASLRAVFCLPPGESATIEFCTAAADDQAALWEIIGRCGRKPRDGMAPHVSFSATTADPSSHANGETTSLGRRRRVDAAHAGRGAIAEEFVPLTVRSANDEVVGRGEPLQFDNGLGGFSASGDEYVIRLRPAGVGGLRRPPLPWSHVVANPSAGFIATESGAGCTWTINSRENRLTPWTNDPVSDPHEEAIYLRDCDRGVFWSPLPGPAVTPVDHQVRYGWGYVEYEQVSAGLRQRTLQFVPREEPVKITRLSLENETTEARTLDLFSYARLALGSESPEHSRYVQTWFDAQCGALFARNPDRDLAERVAFAAVIVAGSDEASSFTCDRQEFIGWEGKMAAPTAVRSAGKLSGRQGTGPDQCFAWQSAVRLAPHAHAECLILLGEAENEAAARRLIAEYGCLAKVEQELVEVRAGWRRLCSAVQIETPSRELDLLVNGWLAYQNLCCRIWGRSAYYQSGGAFGFRDQLQDAAALIYASPQTTRAQILLNAAHQFVEGDVLHWWHLPTVRGVRTRFADDLLWLPLLGAEYVATTGDGEIWDENIPFLAAAPLDQGEAERYLRPRPSGESASLYEHCCRAIDRSLATGEHGLPLMGCGDWNDGMSRIGVEGRGESVWMGFFLHLTIDGMLPICRQRGDQGRVEAYAAHQKRLRAALDSAGWDGQWFRRAYFDDGTPLGTADATECRIDALVQAWSVLSGAADLKKQTQAIDAVEQHLVDRQAGMIRLLTPPFDVAEPDPGYIRGYVPGVRENGGQYTHGVLWYVRALAEMGRGSRAVELLEMLTPIRHTRTPDEVATYQAEPYVVAADVYGEPPHVGRAGWTWYTGSAGWMSRVAVESIMGLSVWQGRELRLNPSISAAWPKCRLIYRPAGKSSSYEIEIVNPRGRERGVRSASLDGAPLSVAEGIATVPLADDGRVHRVVVEL